MKTIGLTGGIAAGKNFVAEIFAKNGAAIFDADKETHDLLESDQLTLAEIQKNFPKAIINQKINRKALGEIVFSDKNKLRILEEIIHPQIRRKYQEFLQNSQNNGHKIAVLNVPLLLETKAYPCDYIIALIAPKEIKKSRFLARSQDFSKDAEELFEKIHGNQIDDEARKSKADFIINTSMSKLEVEKQVLEILHNSLAYF